MPVSLYDSIYASYHPVDTLGKNKKYVKDKSLSSDNQQVYVKKLKNGKNKLLFSVAGTHNFSDVVTDGYLAFGKLKSTTRYKQAEDILNKARDKYQPAKTTMIGHSLGSGVVSLLNTGNKNDKVLTLDKASTLFQPTKSNEQSFRTAGDLVSIANANSTRTTTLKNPNKSTGFLPLDILNSHNVSNIKNEKIFI